MTSTMRMKIAALVGVLTGGFLITPDAPVQAQSFLDRLFNPRSYDEQRRQRRQRRQPDFRVQELERVPQKPVRISAPKYFTYRPDPLKSISLAKLAEAVKTQSLQQSQAATDPAATGESAGDPVETGTATPIDESTPASNVIAETATHDTVAEADTATDDAAAPVDTEVGDIATDTVTPLADTEATEKAAEAERARQEAEAEAERARLKAQAEAAEKARREAAAIAAFDDARRHLSSFKLRTYPQVAKAIIKHYRETPKFIWVTDGRVNDNARAALAAFDRAETFGLSKADYQVTLPDLTEQTSNDGEPATISATATEAVAGTDAVDPRQKALIEFEMKLSAVALTYVLDATRGRVDPNRISGYHDIPRKKVDLVAALNEISAAEDAGGYLDARNPTNAHFKAMAAELAELKQADEAERVDIKPGTLLKPGKSNPELANVVAAIRLRGSETLKSEHEETLAAYQGTPEYTPELVELVRGFQKEHKLKPDGIVGRNTIHAMVGLSNAAKIRKLELAMERTRWLPHDLGERHVFVNQPAFMARFNRPDAEPLSMRVVVGKRSNQTSFFIDRLETVEYNPYWGVPLSIIVNEMMPKLNKDPSYLDRAGYEVTTVSGRKVSSSSVDWYAVATKSQSINVRQYPGRRNALGRVKILFPNKHSIYMHDTPAKSLFKRDRRAFSHGCIRLQHPRAMAAAVLGKSTDYISSRISKGKNESERVKFKIPIYVAYFTAWPDEAGVIQFYGDVYGRDDHLARAVDRTAKSRAKKG